MLGGVRLYASERCFTFENQFNILGDQTIQQFSDIFYERVQIEHFWLQGLLPAEREHLPGKRYGAIGGFANLFATFQNGITGLRSFHDYFAVAFDYGEQIIEIVGHAACEASERFHFLGLTKLIFEILFLRFICLQRRAHAVECASGMGDLIASFSVQRIGVVAAFESLEPFEKICQRARKRVRNQKYKAGAGEHRQKSDTEKKMIQDQ